MTPYSQRVTLRCPSWDQWKTTTDGGPNPHEWETTATDCGMAQGIPGDPMAQQPVSYDINSFLSAG